MSRDEFFKNIFSKKAMVIKGKDSKRFEVIVKE